MMLKVIRVSAMLLVFVGSACAGEILMPPAPQIPPSMYVVEGPSAVDESSVEITDTTAQIVLTLLVSLLP
jgi:hypothetical protein